MTDHPKIIKEITDSWVIQNILSLLTELPTNGDKMKSFTDTIFLIEIDFVRADSIIQNQIDFWGTHIKTPSTGFLSEEEDLFKERPL